MDGLVCPDTPCVCVVNLGCRVNRVESDWMEASFRESGCRLVAEEEADVVVVNTCAVTGEAQAKTRKAVRHAAALPHHPLVVVTGCVANLFPSELVSLGENVHVVASKEGLVRSALDLWGFDRPLGHGYLCGESRSGAPGRLKRGVKVQDGCDNRCTYCIVWRARGVPFSMDPINIESQVRRVLDEGAREVELTGINLGRYRFAQSDGHILDLGGLLCRLAPLVRDAGAIIRASSVEPPEVTPDLVEAMAEHGDVVCAHLHLPLQSGCSSTLARMGRRYDADGFAQAVDLLRGALPRASVSTDVIVGFPGETDAEFAESLAFCESMAFSKIHAFRFSARPDTPAAGMPNKVPADVVRERSEHLRALGDALRVAEATARVGTVEPVLVERVVNGMGRGTSASFHDVTVTPRGAEALGPGLWPCRILSVGSDGTMHANPIS